MRHFVSVFLSTTLVAIGVSIWLYFEHPELLPEALAPAGWYYGDEGYTKARRLAEQFKQPILILIEKDRCRRCKLFDLHLREDKTIKQYLQRFLKVRLNQSDGGATTAITKRYPIQGQLPAIFVHNTPSDMARPIHIIVDLKQIWMPSPTYARGNLMPLSTNTLILAINRTMTLPAKELKAQRQNFAN